jgi:putative transposase
MSGPDRHHDRIAYGEHDRIRIGKVAYTCVETNEDGYRFRRVDDPDWFEGFNFAEMAMHERSCEYRYDREWFKEGKVRARQRSGVADFAEIPERERPKLLWKNAYVDDFMAMVMRGEADRSNDGMTAAIIKIAVRVNALECAKIVRRTDEKRAKGKPVPLKKDGTPRKTRAGTEVVTRNPPTYRTLQRWLRIMEDCDWAPEALRDNYRHCADRSPKLEPEAYDLMVEKANKYATQARPPRARLYDELDEAFRDRNKELAKVGLTAIRLPSRRRFYAEIKSLDAFWVYSRRHTLAAACRKFAAVEDGPAVTRIGERIEMDEWQVSLQTLLVQARVWKDLDPETRKAVGRSRWWLYVAIDRASRCVLGMRLVGKPKASEAVATIRMIISDKSTLSDGSGALTEWSMSTGIGKIVTDWGSAFLAEETRAVVRAMGGTFFHPPAGKAGLRGTVERMFSTIEKRFMGHFTGRTFSNVVQKGDYKAEKNASVPLDVLARALVRHVVDDYHNRPHPGLGGETPHNAFLRLRRTTGRIPVPDPHTQRAIFGIEDTCALDNSGVTILGLRYQNRELHDWFTHKGIHDVPFRLDPEDVGYASVQLGDEWLTVPCRKPELRRVPFRVWREAAADLKARYARDAELSRPVVLASVRAFAELAEECRREAGIMEELDAPDSLRRAREALGYGFALPEWDEIETGDQGGDLLDAIIPATGGKEDGAAAHPAATKSPPAPRTWRMGSRSEEGR